MIRVIQIPPGRNGPHGAENLLVRDASGPKYLDGEMGI